MKTELTGIAHPEKLNMIIRPNCASVINLSERMERMLHEHIEIKCFYSGSSTLLVGSQRITAVAGDVVVINPYEVHATLGGAEEGGKYHLFMIPLDFFSGVGIDELELRSILLANRQCFQSYYPADERLYSIFTGIVREYEEKKTAYRAAIHGLIAEAFSIFLRRGLVSNASLANSGDIMHLYELVEPALHHIRNNYTEKITVDKLAGLCNITKHYFCRVFKTVTKKAAMEYLRDYRIDIADIKLVNSNKSVGEIAEECGFDDTNYFCRCYKLRYGISPGKRKATRNNM